MNKSISLNGVNLILGWTLGLVCFFFGLYTAIDHTVQFFANHNYFFSPFADDILDNSLITYPIAIGKLKLIHIFDPYVDHRVAIEHIQELIDFFFTQGVQSLQPYRLSFLLWLNWIIFCYFVIYPNKIISNYHKMMLAGAYIIFLFSSISTNNYVSSMQITWPIIYLFSLLTFISLAKYCDAINNTHPTYYTYGYMILTCFFLNVVLYTFNIGVVLWPIVFIILMKRGCSFRESICWLGLAFINFYVYIEKNWVLANFFSYTSHTTYHSFIERPLLAFLYYSRIISIPFNESALAHLSGWNVGIGLLGIILNFAFIVQFLKKRKWDLSETIFFGSFLFVSVSIAIISIMRSAVYAMEWRFFTTGLFFLFCSLMYLFFIPIKSEALKKILSAALTCFAFSWLIIFYLPLDEKVSGGPYDLGFFNQVFISEAVGIPINDHFLKASNIIQSSGNLLPHVYVNSVQKIHHKGPYSFWVSRYLDNPIDPLLENKKVTSLPAKIWIVYDYRLKQSPGMLLNVQLENASNSLNNQWEVIFTNHRKIIGFAISAPYLQLLSAFLNKTRKDILLWRGAINTLQLNKNEVIEVWALSNKNNNVYFLGKMTIPLPLKMEPEPTWVWQKTIHYGIV